MADRRLQVFHAVAKHLSFTKAADALFMTQPAVTFQVKQLEEYYNTRLFDRAQGRITLTTAGVLAFEYAERILNLSAELEARLKDLRCRHRSRSIPISAASRAQARAPSSIVICKRPAFHPTRSIRWSSSAVPRRSRDWLQQALASRSCRASSSRRRSSLVSSCRFR